MALETGKKDPYFKKIVKSVAIEVENEFYVFLDSNNEIFYRIINPDHKFPKNFNQINSIIRRLEVLVLSNLPKKEQEIYNYLLANNLAEVLEEKTIDQSLKSLSQIESDINVLVNANQKKYFTYGTNTSLVFIIIAILVLYVFRRPISNLITPTAYSVIFCSLFGGIGALIFNYSKLKDYTANRVIGCFYHFVDGSLRILYGVIYGLIIYLGIKSGIILNFAKDSSLFAFAFICILAGASDTFVSGILKSLEQKSATSDKSSKLDQQIKKAGLKSSKSNNG